AADMRSGQHQLAPQDVGELLTRLGQELPLLPVDDERESDLAHAPAVATARRSAVSAMARHQNTKSAKPSTIRAASAAGSFISADASSITRGAPSRAASTARGGLPGSTSTQAVALENSPTLRQNFQWPQRASTGSTGSSMKRSSSSAASAVSKMPLT